MKLQPGFTDVFISPVTGRITLSALGALPEDYIFVGDRDSLPVPSPALIDIRLEIIKLNSRLAETHFILQTASEDFFNSQALDQLRNGMLSHENGRIYATTLTENKIWRGDENNIPVESDDLSDLEDTVDQILFDLATLQFELGALQFQVGVLETAVGVLQGEVLAIQGQLLLIEGILAGAVAAIEIIQQQIIDINERIDALRLNNIPIDGDIDMMGYRITNLPCDPIYESEPTTFCFIWHLMHDEVNIEWL